MKGNNINGIIFDLDGVIVDTVTFHFRAWLKLANNLGFDINLEQNEQLKGLSRIQSLEKILLWGKKTVTSAEFNKLLVWKNQYYLKSIGHLNQNDLIPGVLPILEYLKEEHIPFALASSSKNSRRILNSLEIIDWFSCIVDGNDVSSAKPDPEVFLLAAEMINIDPKNCIVFEDALAGIEAAKKAGMVVVGVGDKNILKKADFNFRSFREVNIEILRKIIENPSQV